MLQISVLSDIADAAAQLRSITDAKQLRFAVAKALTKTAQAAQAEVRTNMPNRFTIRRQWVIQGIKITPATRSDLTATVYSRDPFMGLQETGGTKNPLRNYIAVPTRAVKRTKADNIRAAERPKALGDKAHIIELHGHKWLALKKPRKGRSGNELRLLYLLIPRATIKARLGLAADSERIVRAQFVEQLQQTLAAAMKSARR